MSTQYTPTTDEVREAWVDHQTGIASRRPMHRDDFNRWFDEEIRDAKREAFERGVHQGADDNELGIETYTNPYEKED